MTASIIDGKKIAADIKEHLKEKITALPNTPQLAIVLVGNDEPSLIYVRNKQKAAAQIGLLSKLYHLDENTSEKELLQLINNLNTDSATNGIIVQLPLPAHINTSKIINAISPLKDVDGFHPYNTGMLQNNEKPYFIAATPLGVMRLIKSVIPELSGKNVVIIGASLIVGRPLATLLLNQACTVTITHAQTKNIKELTAKADILIAACGVAKLVKADWIKENALLVDVGINREGKHLCGDIDFDDVKNKALAITPVPGGVGPMTIAMLLANTVDACLLQKSPL